MSTASSFPRRFVLLLGVKAKEEVMSDVLSITTANPSGNWSLLVPGIVETLTNAILGACCCIMAIGISWHKFRGTTIAQLHVRSNSGGDS